MVSLVPYKIRKDFPVLKKRKIIYFDNACTTLRPIQVLRAIAWYYENSGACAERSVHFLGNELNEKISKARETVLNFFGADDSYSVIFTKNTTEAINIVANGFNFGKKRSVVLSDREHNSNLVPWLKQKNRGIKCIFASSKKNFEFDLENFENTLKKNVGLVSIVHISNIDGYKLPVSEIVSVAHDKNIPVMLDAAQSAGHVKINLKKMGADMLAFSGHKMCGPFIGALVCKKEILKRLSPLIFGGGMVEETTTKSYKIKDDYKGFEAGLQDCASILGLETACKYLEKIGFKRIENYENKLTKRLTKGLSNFQEVSFIGVAEPKNKIAIVNFVLKGTSSMDVAMLLDELGGIAVRSGMHCAHSWYKKYSLPPSVRASLYFYNTTEEVDIFLEKIEQITKIKKGKDISRTRR